MTYATRKALRHSARHAAIFAAAIIGITVLAAQVASALPVGLW